MASGTGNYLSNKLLNSVFNGAAFPSIATVYIALYTATPSGASGSGTEVSGGSYARVAVTANTTNFPTTSTQQEQNATAITFPTATADWGTVTHCAIYDASTAGNELYWGALTASKVVSNGDTASFAINALTVTQS